MSKRQVQKICFYQNFTKFDKVIQCEKMKPTFNLPPGLVSGSTKATLEVRIDLLKSTSENQISDCNFESAKFIKLQWWGETQEQTAKLPVESGAKVTYNVLTGPSHFRDYLQDCGRLYLETLSHSGKTLGKDYVCYI